MYSKPNPNKASKGTVQVISSNDRLQLRFRFAGKRHYLSMGLPDSAVNRKAAEAKARQIELDIVSGNFDPTLAKYKPQAAPSTVVNNVTNRVDSKPSLAELWEKFIEYKRPQCSSNTMRLSYGVFSNHVKKLPTHDLDKACEIRDYILNTIPLYSGKRFITRLSACCEWAIESGMLTDNPFQEMAKKLICQSHPKVKRLMKSIHLVWKKEMQLSMQLKLTSFVQEHQHLSIVTMHLLLGFYF